jgi:hypothetical protein
MPRRRFPALARICAHCGLHWVQQDGKPPRPYCSTTCRQAAEGRPLRSADPPAEPALPVRTRRVRARLITITCAWCGETTELAQLPGPRPRYCGPDCRAAAAREHAAERMRRFRTRHAHPTRAVTPTQSA